MDAASPGRTTFYATRIDVGLVLMIVFAALLLIGVLGMGVMAWRLVRGNEQMEAGVSMGRQMFGRSRRD